MNLQTHLLIIYTGGTIGMTESYPGGPLVPFDFINIADHLPELKRLDLKIDVAPFQHPVDSSDIDPSVWKKIADLVVQNYQAYDGFVILHGTDTMAYTASALSFMLRGIQKPVILTGAQLPIGKIRTDGKENLITAIEIAASKENNSPVIQEVAVCFGAHLFRGNRVSKVSAEGFEAFRSPNYDALAEIGLHIHYRQNLLYRSETPFAPQLEMNTNVGLIKLFPGISQRMFDALVHSGPWDGMVIETFGSGNIPQKDWMIDAIKKLIDQGTMVINISQCTQGYIDHQLYQNAKVLDQMGVIEGKDMTTEAAITKLMNVLGSNSDHHQKVQEMMLAIAGECSFKN